MLYAKLRAKRKKKNNLLKFISYNLNDQIKIKKYILFTIKISNRFIDKFIKKI